MLLDVLPLAHNLPLACPGMQGFLISGGTVVLSTTVRGEDVFKLVQANKVTHIHVVPALLIRWINDPTIGNYDLSSLEFIQSGGQRFQPEVRRKTKELIPSVFVQENFGMAEGLLMFVRKDDPEDVRMETVGLPISPDDEVRILDDDDNIVKFGEVGEFCCRGPYTLRGYFGTPEHNVRAFTSDGFYRSGDLMQQHPSGRYMVEGRKKDLINRGGEKISAEEIENLILTHPAVQNVACIPYPDDVAGRAHVRLHHPEEGPVRELRFPHRPSPEGRDGEAQAARADRDDGRFPALGLRQGVEEAARRGHRQEGRGREEGEGDRVTAVGESILEGRV